MIVINFKFLLNLIKIKDFKLISKEIIILSLITIILFNPFLKDNFLFVEKNLTIKASNDPFISLKPHKGSIKFSNSWTIMIYIAADNDLESCGKDDLSEITSAIGKYDTGLMTVTTLYDGWEPAIRDSKTHWSDTTIFRVMGDIESHDEEFWGELNMGDPKTLERFILRSIQDFPAEHYCLILWNHGLGWETGITDYNEYQSLKSGTCLNYNRIREFLLPEFRKSICWDDRSFGDALTETELTTVLKKLPIKLDVIAFDACFMGCFEVAFSIRQYADYMVATEDSIAGTGFYYTGFLNDLKNRIKTGQNYSPAILSTSIAKYTFQQQFIDDSIGDVTEIAVIDLTLIEEIAKKIDTFANEITLLPSNVIRNLNEKVQNISDYGLAEQIDLYAFLDLSSEIEPSLASNTEELKQIISQSIMWEDHLVDYVPSSHGLTIYLPWLEGLWIEEYQTVPSFGRENGWANTAKYFADQAIVYTPPSFLIESDCMIQDFLQEEDILLYLLPLHKEEEVTINLVAENTTDFDVYIFDSNFDVVARAEEEVYPEIIHFNAWYADDFLLIINAFRGNGTFGFTIEFNDDHAEVDLMTCLDQLPVDNDGNQKIDDFRFVFLIDSPRNMVGEFSFKLFGYYVSPVFYWTQELEIGRQLAIIYIPGEYFYHFLDEDESWGEFREENINGKYLSHQVDPRYLIKFTDLDPNLQFKKLTNTSIEVFYNGDPPIIVIPSLTTLKSYQSSSIVTNEIVFSVLAIQLVLQFLKKIRKRGGMKK